MPTGHGHTACRRNSSCWSFIVGFRCASFSALRGDFFSFFDKRAIDECLATMRAYFIDHRHNAPHQRPRKLAERMAAAYFSRQHDSKGSTCYPVAKPLFC